jgi:hypothetical protein
MVVDENKKGEMKMEKSKPNYEKRLGNIRVAVWENTTADGKRWHNSALTRRYKAGDDWKEAPTFNGLADLVLAAECVEFAKAWIAGQEEQ